MRNDARAVFFFFFFILRRYVIFAIARPEREGNATCACRKRRTKYYYDRAVYEYIRLNKTKRPVALVVFFLFRGKSVE